MQFGLLFIRTCNVFKSRLLVFIRYQFGPGPSKRHGPPGAAAVLSALGQRVSDDEFAVMDDLHACTGVPVPKNLAALREKPVRHRDVIDREDMLSYVLRKAGEKQW